MANPAMKTGKFCTAVSPLERGRASARAKNAGGNRQELPFSISAAAICQFARQVR
jgi:hypothetical protein